MLRREGQVRQGVGQRGLPPQPPRLLNLPRGGSLYLASSPHPPPTVCRPSARATENGCQGHLAGERTPEAGTMIGVFAKVS